MIRSLDDVVKMNIASRLLADADYFYAQKVRIVQQLTDEGWERHLLVEKNAEMQFGKAYEEEKATYGFENFKQQLGLGTYSSQLLKKKEELSRTRNLPTIKIYDALQATPEKREQYKQQVDDLRVQTLTREVEQFGKEAEHLIFDHQNQQDEVETFIIETVESLLPDFKYDKSLSAKDYFSLSCLLHDPWKIRIFIDRRCIFTYGALSRLQMSLLICNKKNKGFNVFDKYMDYPRFIYGDFMIKTAPELLTSLKYNCRIYQLHMEMFNEPIKEAFEELEQEGYSN